MFLRKRILVFYLVLGVLKAGHSQISCDIINITKITLEESPIIRSNYLSINDASADVQLQRSVFDYRLNSELSYQKSRYSLFGVDPRNEYLSNLLTNNWDFNTVLSKKLKSSQVLEVGLQYLTNNNNFPFNDFSLPASPYVGNYTALLNLSFTQPLLRGRGRQLATISERTSELYVDITRNSVTYASSREILEMGSAYWAYYSAYKQLYIYKENEGRVRKVLEMTQELVKADKKPESDLAQIKADLANQERLTVSAQQRVYSTRINLGRVIGLNKEDSELLGNPLNDFPTLEESGYKTTLSNLPLIDLARENRQDFIASQKTYKAVELQNQLARNNMKPQIDLTGFVFNGNASQGNGIDFKMSSLAQREGNYLGGGAKLTFSFPLNNNQARGHLAKSQVSLNDQLINNQNLERNIELNINIALNDLNSSVLILERAKLALESYKVAFENEQERFSSGLTTLINLILFQERLTSAELDYIQAQQQFSVSILNLRHETGTLLPVQENSIKINLDNYYTVPFK